MTRSIASWFACASLIGLTMLTWRVASDADSAAALGGLALLKISIIGAVFLELDRSRPAWALLFVGYFAAILAGAVWLIAG